MRFFCLVTLLFLNGVAGAQSLDSGEIFAPPKYSLTDENNVNLVTGQPTFSLNAVGIGGVKGLQHSMSFKTSSLIPVAYKYTGYWDKYEGFAKIETLFARDYGGWQRDILRVYDHHGSMDFEVWILDDSNRPFATKGTAPYTSNYAYKAIDRSANQLIVSGNNNEFLQWLKPNGDKSIYYRGPNSDSRSTGHLIEMIYANGYSIKINRDYTNKYRLAIHSVTTNTGYQLKYEYDAKPPPLEPSKVDVSHTPSVGYNSETWAAYNPKKIVAVNNAVDFCDPLANPRRGSGATKCSYSKPWPTAEVFWPGGMPRAFSVGESQLKIVDSSGADTIFYIEALESGKWPNKYLPRLVAVKSANSNVQDYKYSYKQFLDTHDSIYNGTTVAIAQYVSVENVLSKSWGKNSGSYIYELLRAGIGSGYMAGVSSRNASGKVGGDVYTSSGVQQFEDLACEAQMPINLSTPTHIHQGEYTRCTLATLVSISSKMQETFL